MKGRDWLWAIGGTIIVVPVAQFVGKSLAETQNVREMSAPRQFATPTFADVEVLVGRQAAEGVTEADFTQEFLTNLEGWVVERTGVHAKKYLDAASIPETERRFIGESTFIERYGHKLAVVRIRIGTTTPIATIHGIVGDELVKVMCVNRSKDHVPIADGPCDDKLQEVFN